jgi:hypothetical protein
VCVANLTTGGLTSSARTIRHEGPSRLCPESSRQTKRLSSIFYAICPKYLGDQPGELFSDTLNCVPYH